MEVHSEQRKKQPKKTLIILSFTENTALMTLLMKTTNKLLIQMLMYES